MAGGHHDLHDLGSWRLSSRSGLALAAVQRGFAAEVWVNQRGPLFVEGVRDPNKKRVMRLAHESFLAQARSQEHSHTTTRRSTRQRWLPSYAEGANVLILISTYRMDNRKVPALGCAERLR